MLKNYLKVALRSILRNKTYSLINILGLAIGIASCVLITIYIVHEISYDHFHENADNIYRVTVSGDINGQPANFAVSMAPLAPTAVSDFPEVLNAVRLEPGGDRTIISYEDQRYFEEDVLFTNSAFFEVFSYDLIRGTAAEVLSAPNSIVLSLSLARKYFGYEDPLGHILTLNGDRKYTVTGVCADPPTNSHLTFTAIGKMNEEDPGMEHWGSIRLYNYLLLDENADIPALEKKLTDLIMERMELNYEEHGIQFFLGLQPLTDMHLHSTFDYDIGTRSNIAYIYTFSAIAIFILLIACINFMNLTTSRSMTRALEIGIRKVLGADRITIMKQFLGESLILTVFAAVFALGLVELMLPGFNQFVNKDLTLSFISNWQFLGLMVLFILVAGLFAGSYPALYLSAFNPIPVMKGQFGTGKGRSRLRYGLVLIQFIISITLITATMIIYQQLDYFQNKRLGFDREQVLILPLSNEDIRGKTEILKKAFTDIPGIQQISSTSGYPASGSVSGHGYYPEGYSEDKPWLFKTYYVDAEFLDVFGIELTEGRNFSKKMATDSEAILLNETARAALGWQNPIGKIILSPLEDSEEKQPNTVIGVVADFHTASLRDKIEPMVIHFHPDMNMFLSMKLDTGTTFGVLDQVEAAWNELAPDLPFDYHFLDEQFDSMHRNERNLGTLFLYFTLLAIFIASLGLFGLASYSTERRIKEIGIRKSLGANITQIVFILTREFAACVILANLVAWPLAFYMMNRWLQNFAYRISMGPGVFILAGVAALIIALTTVSYQSIKAALANPVDSLRYE